MSAVSSVVEYRVVGHDLQLVELTLSPGQGVFAEAGAMVYVEEGIVFESRLGDGSQRNQGVVSKFMGAAKRKLSGNSAFLVHYKNEGAVPRCVAFSGANVGQIVPVDLGGHGGSLTCQRGAFLLAEQGTELDMEVNLRLSGLLGKEGAIFQKLSGPGRVFLHACGAIVRRDLREESLTVDSYALVAFSEGISYGIQRAGNVKSMIFGREGLFLTKLEGSGSVYLQSLSVEGLSRALGASSSAVKK